MTLSRVPYARETLRVDPFAVPVDLNLHIHLRADAVSTGLDHYSNMLFVLLLEYESFYCNALVEWYCFQSILKRLSVLIFIIFLMVDTVISFRPGLVGRFG